MISFDETQIQKIKHFLDKYEDLLEESKYRLGLLRGDMEYDNLNHLQNEITNLSDISMTMEWSLLEVDKAKQILNELLIRISER